MAIRTDNALIDALGNYGTIQCTRNYTYAKQYLRALQQYPKYDNPRHYTLRELVLQTKFKCKDCLSDVDVDDTLSISAEGFR